METEDEKNAQMLLEVLTTMGYSLTLILKEHKFSKTVMEMLRKKLRSFGEKVKLMSRSHTKIKFVGSSFDDLHLCRLVTESGKKIFKPLVDFNYMLVYTGFTLGDITTESNVILDEDTCKRHTDKSDHFAVMVPSENPGYVKVRLSKKGYSMIGRVTHKGSESPFSQDLSCIPNNIFKDDLAPDVFESFNVLYSRQQEEEDYAEGHKERENEGFGYEFLHALPCAAWPGLASRWPDRNRPGKWPSKKLIEEIVKEQCYVCPLGYYDSKEKEQEWQVLFTDAEQHLCESLSHVQKTCYSLVKMMLKQLLPNDSILTSYHIKTLMFWFIEQYEPTYNMSSAKKYSLAMWMICFVKYIGKALEHHYIPHYFVPRNNLIRHVPKKEIDKTAKEVLVIMGHPFVSIGNICNSLKCLDVIKEEKFDLTDKSVVQSQLLLYQPLVQALYRLGIEQANNEDIALKAFKYILELNREMKDYIKTESSVYGAKSLPELIKPLVIAFTQNHELERAVNLCLMTINNDERLVRREFPEVYTNTGCLYNYMKDDEKDIKKRDVLAEKARKYFIKALRYVKNSSSLHFAYASLIYHTHGSLHETMKHLRKAVEMPNPSKDDESLLHLDIAGTDHENFKARQVYVPGKVAAYHMLINCLMDMGEIYEARRSTREFLMATEEFSLKRRAVMLQMVSLCCTMCGLDTKAELLTERSLKLDVLNMNEEEEIEEDDFKEIDLADLENKDAMVQKKRKLPP